MDTNNILGLVGILVTVLLGQGVTTRYILNRIKESEKDRSWITAELHKRINETNDKLAGANDKFIRRDEAITHFTRIENSLNRLHERIDVINDGKEKGR